MNHKRRNLLTSLFLYYLDVIKRLCMYVRLSILYDKMVEIFSRNCEQMLPPISTKFALQSHMRDEPPRPTRYAAVHF